MATTTNGSTTSKIIRIHQDEKVLLSQLRENYGNDYKKYFECIRRGTNIPSPIRKIYKLLDEHKAYRRISDYFHRERVGKKARSSKLHGLNKSYHRSLARRNINLSQSISTIQRDHKMSDEDDNIHQQPTSLIITNDNDELNEMNHRMDDDRQDIQPSPPINSTHQVKRRLSLINNRQQSMNDFVSSKSDLLSVRASIQKALHEIDRVIISKTEDISQEHNDEQQKLSIEKTNDYCHSKLDDFVRSLSNVVVQQQENARLIITESSALLVNDNKQIENLSTQDSIKHILERLNTLVDRGHSVYDKIENILSEF